MVGSGSRKTLLRRSWGPAAGAAKFPARVKLTYWSGNCAAIWEPRPGWRGVLPNDQAVSGAGPAMAALTQKSHRLQVQ